MIDAESEIFANIAARVRSVYPNLYMTGEYVRAPARFPCVAIEEKNNAVWRNSRDTSEIERQVAVMYEVNIYSNLKNGAKRECKELAAAVDEAMRHIGFTRAMMNPMPNLSDATIYRMTGRYQAIIGMDTATNKIVIYKR